MHRIISHVYVAPNFPGKTKQNMVMNVPFQSQRMGMNYEFPLVSITCGKQELGRQLTFAEANIEMYSLMLGT